MAEILETPQSSSNSNRKKEREEERIQKLTDSITEWWNVIEQEDLSKDVVLIVGITGSGKTTIANFLGGQLDTLEACKIQRRMAIIDSNNLIGEPSPISKTEVPMFYHCKRDNKTVLVVADCPGFGDNRGSLVDIVAMTLVKRVTEKSQRIKFLFVIPFSAVNSSFDRTHFSSLVEHATNLFGDSLKTIENSIGFIVNMIHNFSPLSATEEITDEDVKEEIGEYLAKYSTTFSLESSNNENMAQRQKFVKLFFNSLASKVCFVRYPKKPGNLSEDAYFRDVRKTIQDFCENKLEGTRDQNFGYAFSPASLLEIKTKLVPHLTLKTENLIEDIAKEMESQFNPEPIQIGDREAISKVEEQLRVLKALGICLDAGKGSKPSMLLRSMAYVVEITIDPLKLSNLTARVEQLSYFLELSGGSFGMNLFRPLKELQENLLKRLQKSVMKPMFDSIYEHVNKIVSRKAMAAFVENHLQTCTVSFENILEILRAAAAGVETSIQNQDAGLEVVLENMLKNLKYDPTAISLEIEKLKKLLKQWNDFKGIWQSKEKFEMKEDEWLQPAKSALQKLRSLNRFYEFLIPLQTKILEYESYQAIANLSEQHWKDDQNLFNILETRGVFREVSQEIKDLYLEESHCKAVLKQLLKVPQPEILATNGGTTYVKGRCIKLSSMVDERGKLFAMLQNTQRRLHTLFIFASEKIFQDSNILYRGEPLSIIFVSPQFEVIGAQREIALEGENAPAYEPECAEGGNLKGHLSGYNGLPGRVGANGGSFLGIFYTVINGKALTIRSKGGNGGKGQNGGNGEPGESGRDANSSHFPSAKTFGNSVENRPLLGGDYDVIEEITDDCGCCPFFSSGKQPVCVVRGEIGQPGGNGGHGGSGGNPGTAGIVNVFYVNRDDSDVITEIRETGSDGPHGIGGKGAKGGENGVTLKRGLKNCCFVNYWGNTISCRDSKYANSGRDGEDGGYSFGKQTPRSITSKATWYPLIKNEYDQFLVGQPSLSGSQLVEAFKRVIGCNNSGSVSMRLT